MRRRALESDIVIVNHHLFFADLSIRRQAQNAPDAGVLPEAAAVVFDEAHELEEIASSYFGVSISNVRFEELARDVEILLRAKQALSASLTAAAELVRERSRMFFGALPEPKGADGRMPFTDREEFLEQSGDVYLGLVNALERLAGELERLRGVEEASGLKKRTAELTNQLMFLLESTDRGFVFWIERRSSSGLRQSGTNTWLQATPIEIASLLASDLFESIPSVVLTSATLTVQGNFDHIERRLGLTGARQLVVPSHFRYGEQALLYLPPEMPDPREPAFTKAAVDKICEILEITRGRAFCLFTSYSQMRQVHEQLIARVGYPLLLQGTAPRNALLEEFRITPNAVLLGYIVLLAGGRCSGRTTELCHNRQTSLCRSQRSRGGGTYEGDRSGRRQCVRRISNSFGGDRAEAGIWPAHSLAARSRRAGSAGSSTAAAAIWARVLGEFAAVSGDTATGRRSRILRVSCPIESKFLDNACIAVEHEAFPQIHQRGPL